MLLISTAVLVVSFSACKKKTETETPTGTYQTGVFVVNEGPFNSGTGTISYYNRDSKVVTNDIFQLANQLPLGNIVQSINMFNGKGYIVVNNANKIEVVEAHEFKSIASISGLTSPRSMLQVDDSKAYVTEWGSATVPGSVQIINLNTNTVMRSIATGRKGPENMVKKGNYVYVTCKGAYDYDSMVTVINTLTDGVVANIAVGPNPDDIAVDADGFIWVLCSGKYKSDYSSLEFPGRLVKINPTTNTVVTSFVLSSLYSQPAGLDLSTDKRTLYYNYDGAIHTQAIASANLETAALVNRSFYSIGIDPTTNIIYAGDAGNYASEGKVVRYTIAGAVIDSLNVGVIPGGFFFK